MHYALAMKIINSQQYVFHVFDDALLVKLGFPVKWSKLHVMGIPSHDLTVLAVIEDQMKLVAFFIIQDLGKTEYIFMSKLLQKINLSPDFVEASLYPHSPSFTLLPRIFLLLSQ